MIIEIPDNILQGTNLTKADLLVDIAVMLYQKEVLTVRSAAELINLSSFEFENILYERGVNLHYDFNDFKKDMHSLDKLRE